MALRSSPVSHNPPPPRTGFSLTEVMVAGFVFFIFCVPFFLLLTTSKKATHRQSRQVEALFLAQGFINRMRHNSAERGQNFTLPSNNVPPDFEVRQSFRFLPGNHDGLMMYQVVVHWKERKKNKFIELSTLISSKPDVYRKQRRSRW